MELGDRMKCYEEVTKTKLPKRTYTIIRLDGKAFHTFTKGLKRPYDKEFTDVMDKTALYLCKNIQGAIYAYVQSDEISILLCDFKENETTPWFGGEIQKMASISASMATAYFNSIFKHSNKLAMFDSRIFSISSKLDAMNCFIWRQQDCVKNSISMAAHTYFSTSYLHKKTGNEKQELLFKEKGINWNDYPVRFKRGGFIFKQIGLKEIDSKYSNQKDIIEKDGKYYVPRESFEIIECPHFSIENLEFITPTLK